MAVQVNVTLVLGATATIPMVTVWAAVNVTSIIPLGAADTLEQVVKSSESFPISAVRHPIISQIHFKSLIVTEKTNSNFYLDCYLLVATGAKGMTSA
jgi:hypothetical protein